MKKSLFFYCLFLVAINIKVSSQTLTANDIIDRSRSYYNTFHSFSVKVISKFKSSIAEDTSKWQRQCYIDRNTGRELFLDTSGSIGYFVRGNDHYEILFNKNQFIKYKQKDRKYLIHPNTYTYYPFINYDNFLQYYYHNKMMVSETDSTFSLTGLVYKIIFRKTDYSVSRIIKLEYIAMGKGFEYRETIFQPCIAGDEFVAASLEEASDIISSDSNIYTNKKEAYPDNFDHALLRNVKVLNGAIMLADGKTLFLDFFYQGCMPCLKSQPYVNELFAKADTNARILAVAGLPGDTLNMDKYINRYGIQYPVIMGDTAVFIRKYFKISVWPTFIVISPDGKVLEYRAGHSSSFFKRIRKQYFSGR